MDHVRTALKAIQWERAKGELRAFAALSGSYPNSGTGEISPKFLRTVAAIETFIKNFEDEAYHE